MEIQESGEMYLETILVLEQKNGSVRAIDIAEDMNFSKPSVSRAMGILKDNGYINIESNRITLTEKGREIAEKIYGRHKNLSKMLMMLGVSEKTATEDACKIEHVISDESMNKIIEHMKEHS